MPWNRWNMHPCHGFWWHVNTHAMWWHLCHTSMGWHVMATCNMSHEYYVTCGNSIDHYKHKLKQWTMLFWAHQKLVKVAPLTFLPPFPPFDASSLRVDVECKHHKGMTSSTFGYPIFWTQTNLRYMFPWLGGYFQLGPQLYYILYTIHTMSELFIYI